MPTALLTYLNKHKNISDMWVIELKATQTLKSLHQLISHSLQTVKILDKTKGLNSTLIIAPTTGALNFNIIPPKIAEALAVTST